MLKFQWFLIFSPHCGQCFDYGPPYLKPQLFAAVQVPLEKIVNRVIHSTVKA